MTAILRDVAAECDVVPDFAGSYPGGKSGAGVYQRLINLIPRHRILVSAFAGHCGIVRNIKPAEHTIVIDPDAAVCEWWSSWCRSKHGRALEVHCCDGIDWLRFRFGLTEYSAPRSHDDAGSVASSRGTAGTLDSAAMATAAESGDVFEYFVFADPPYVLSERAHGAQYRFELDDADHLRFLRILSQIPVATAAAMVCGYASPLYAPLNHWRSIDHRVPTRGGLQDERIWLNYPDPESLHDHRYVGDNRRQRERIRRRQVNWQEQLAAMPPRERAAMLDVLTRHSSGIPT